MKTRFSKIGLFFVAIYLVFVLWSICETNRNEMFWQLMLIIPFLPSLILFKLIFGLGPQDGPDSANPQKYYFICFLSAWLNVLILYYFGKLIGRSRFPWIS